MSVAPCLAIRASGKRNVFRQQDSREQKAQQRLSGLSGDDQLTDHAEWSGAMWDEERVPGT